MTDEVDASLNFRHDGADNEGASPLITPQNREKHKKTKITRRKKPPCRHP